MHLAGDRTGGAAAAAASNLQQEALLAVSQRCQYANGTLPKRRQRCHGLKRQQSSGVFPAQAQPVKSPFNCTALKAAVGVTLSVP